MRRFLLVPFLAVVLIPAARADDPPVLVASVGLNDGFTIDLADGIGKHISRLLPGTYTVLVHDYSAMHNFHLASESDRETEFRTDLEFVGDATFTATFRDGHRYVYACEPHWQTMWGDFFVSSPPPVRKLAGRVSAAGATFLSTRTAPAGAYRITISDRSAAANFHLVGPGVNARTGIAFKGSRTWGVQLRAGTYRYFSDRAPSKRKSLVVR